MEGMRGLYYRLATLLLCFATVTASFAQGTASQTTSVYTQDALQNGYEAYRKQDWTSASIFLHRAVTEPKNNTDNIWYMLIMSEMSLGDYDSVISDCNYFERQFPRSDLLSFVVYQKGRAQHYNGQNEDSVRTLSDFCHR